MTDAVAVNPKQAFALDPMGKEAQDMAAQERITSPGQRARMAAQIDILDREGWVILPGLLSPEKLADLRAGMDELHKVTPFGRSPFEGENAQRIYGLMGKMPAVWELAAHLDVLAVVEGHLNDQIQLSSAAFYSLFPGQAAQVLHEDDTYYRTGKPFPPISVSVAWPIDDYREDNGATIVMPRSHKQPDYHNPGLPTTRAVTPAGSAILWDGSLWHAGGANNSDAIRRSIILTYNRGWLRQQENLYLSVPRDTVRRMPRVVQRLIGWWVVGATVGVVDGFSPLKTL